MKKLQQKIITFLKSNNAYVVKIILASTDGKPDIVACFNGRFIGIEIKETDKDTLSELQRLNLNKIKLAGGYAIEARSLDDVRRLLDELDKC